MTACRKVVGSFEATPLVAGSLVVAGSCEGSFVAWGAWVAGAGVPPQADKIMLARTSKLSKANNLRIFLLLTKIERFIENVLTFHPIVTTHVYLEQPPPFEF